MRSHEEVGQRGQVGRKSAIAPPGSASAGMGALGSANPPGPRMSRQMLTSTWTTLPNSPLSMRRRISLWARLKR